MLIDNGPHGLLFLEVTFRLRRGREIIAAKPWKGDILNFQGFHCMFIRRARRLVHRQRSNNQA
jgi:hypothetical protein